MSAAEIIEQIKQLPPEERRELLDYLQNEQAGVSALHDRPDAFMDRQTFEKAANWAVQEHRELLARLAK